VAVKKKKSNKKVSPKPKTPPKAVPAAKAQPKTSNNPRVRFETTQGHFIAEIYSDVPTTAKNFLELTARSFFDGLIFHRYEPGFVIQGGDPTGTGMGGSEKNIPLEITHHKHIKGALGMARSQDPHSASSQFYVCLTDTPFLDGNYAVFGKVLEGMDSVLALRRGDKMVKVTLVD
jgi:peptidyl-prolyl cis-trans isomerase B (cyclophilin B)